MIISHIFPFLPLSFLLLIGYTIQEMSEEEEEEKFFFDDYDEEEDDRFLKVAIVEDKAYWVVNNTFWEADVIDDEIIKEDARQVNAFDLDFRDVNKMMTILDNIEDWKN